MHFDKFDVWQYRDIGGNCWDFTRQWLIEREGVPECSVPQFGILPGNKIALTKEASKIINSSFVECVKEEGIVAAQFIGKFMVHMGVVVGENVVHTNAKTGTRRDSISVFSSQLKTRFYKYENKDT